MIRAVRFSPLLLPLLSLAAISFTSCTGTSTSLVSGLASTESAAVGEEKPSEAADESAALEETVSAASLTAQASLAANPSISQSSELSLTETVDLPSSTPPAPVSTSYPGSMTVLTSVPLTPVSSRPTGQIMMVRTTAYSHLQEDSLPYGKLSAAGNELKYSNTVRSAAADWSKYPMGTRFTIEGLPYEYIIDDYGSALVGTQTIDLYKPMLDKIGRWGVRNVPIKILEWGSMEKSYKILKGRTHVKNAGHVRRMVKAIESEFPHLNPDAAPSRNNQANAGATANDAPRGA